MADSDALRKRRSRHHKVGDHSLCKPGRCSSLPAPPRPEIVRKPKEKRNTFCIESGCGKKARARQLCSAHYGLANPRDYSDRMTAACDMCGRAMWAGYADIPRCKDCRRIASAPYGKRPNAKGRTKHAKTCQECGSAFETINPKGKYCSRICGGNAAARATLTFRPASHPKVKRAKLEARAPGLSNKRRLALLAEWRRKGAICVYCGISAADTVDHVVPLVLGGTNYEGNLAPSCRKCNSSKAGKTVTEWRHGVRVSRHALPMPAGAFDGRL